MPPTNRITCHLPQDIPSRFLSQLPSVGFREFISRIRLLSLIYSLTKPNYLTKARGLLNNLTTKNLTIKINMATAMTLGYLSIHPRQPNLTSPVSRLTVVQSSRNTLTCATTCAIRHCQVTLFPWEGGKI